MHVRYFSLLSASFKILDKKIYINERKFNYFTVLSILKLQLLPNQLHQQIYLGPQVLF